MLRYLVDRAGRVVSKQDLFDAVWRGGIVSDAALTVCIAEIRRALGDNARNARFIETLHRRGYRFIADVERGFGLHGRAIGEVPDFVGREQEVQRLIADSDTAFAGRRRVVFVSGNAGIGKTALVNYVASKISADLPDLWLAVGQCVDNFGEAEALMPLVDCVRQWILSPRGSIVAELVREVAPSLGYCIHGAETSSGGDIAPVISGRVFREFTDLIEALSAEWPVAIIIEDAQWSDESTLAWLSYVSRRKAPARLLVVCTFRTLENSEITSRVESLAGEMRPADLCELSGWTPPEVAAYLANSGFVHGVEHDGADELVPLLHERTDGNPLFIVALTEELAKLGQESHSMGAGTERDFLESAGSILPSTLMLTIRGRLAELDESEREVVKSASIAGQVFDGAAVAACSRIELEEVEALLDSIHRKTGLITVSGASEWPDDGSSTRYRFVHSLYWEAVYETIPPGRRSPMHRRVAESLVAWVGRRSRSVAAEIASHFERARRWQLAARYFLDAAQNLVDVTFIREAVALFRRGEEMARRADGASTDTASVEADLLLGRGLALIATEGGASAEARECFDRAAVLAEELRDDDRLFIAVYGVRASSLAEAKLDSAHRLGLTMHDIATRTLNESHALQTHAALGNTAFQKGEIAQATEQLDAGIDIFNRSGIFPHRRMPDIDPGMFCFGLRAVVAALEDGDGVAMIEHARRIAQQIGDPFTIATADNFAAWFYQVAACPRKALEYAQSAMSVADKQGLQSARILAMARTGWAATLLGGECDGLSRLDEAISAWKLMGSRLGLPHLLHLRAEARRHVSDREGAMKDCRLAIACSNATGERWNERAVLALAEQIDADNRLE